MTSNAASYRESPSPSLVAAWMALGSIDIDRVPWWAAQWLADGHDGPVLRELAGLGAHNIGVHDLLPSALAETGADVPADEVTSAIVILTDLAAICLAWRADERWVAQKVQEVVRLSDYSSQVIDLPLGQVYGADDAWAGGWGPSPEELRVEVRAACQAQISTGSRS